MGFMVGICLIFSSINVRLSSVTRTMICTFRFLFSIRSSPFTTYNTAGGGFAKVSEKDFSKNFLTS